MGSSQSTATNEDGTKKGLYQRTKEKQRGPGVTDEDILKYTGKTREQLNEWADTAPGVGKNQLAGKHDVGPTSGFGGVAVAGGLGGWGLNAGLKGENRGLKFPPKKEETAKELDDDSD